MEEMLEGHSRPQAERITRGGYGVSLAKPDLFRTRLFGSIDAEEHAGWQTARKPRFGHFGHMVCITPFARANGVTLGT
jgi:hypothetical protein